jgi:hypothetical protein
MNGENARVIRKAFLEKSQGSETLDRNCIARHTVTENRPPNGILENALGPPRCSAELRRS